MGQQQNSPAHEREAVACHCGGDSNDYTIRDLGSQRVAARWPILAKHWAPPEVLAALSAGGVL